MRKGFASILILVIIITSIAVAGFVYFKQKPLSQSVQVSPTPSPQDETANWKTYTDNKYRFSIKYPTDWEVIDITNEPVATDISSNGMSITTPLKVFYQNNFYENVDQIITFLSPEDYRPVVPKKLGELWISGIRLETKKGSKTKELEKYDNEKYKKSTSIINGIEITTISILNERTGADMHTAIFEKEGWAFKLTDDLSSPAENEKIFNQILSNFKFLDQSVDMTNWKTYTYKEFSIKLPPMWYAHDTNKTLYGYEVIFSYPVDNPTLQNWKPGQKAGISIGRSLKQGKSINQQAEERIKMPYSYLNNSTVFTTIDGHQAIVLSSNGNHHEEIIINHKEFSYIISLGTPLPGATDLNSSDVPLDEIKPIFDQILSTFKFIE